MIIYPCAVERRTTSQWLTSTCHAQTAVVSTVNAGGRWTITGGEALGPIAAGAWWRSRWLVVLLAVCAAVPLLIPSFPPLIDLPAHYSGYYVQENISHSRSLARFYTFNWTFIPNLGVELLVVPLTPILGLQLSVKLIVAAIPALAVAGMLWTSSEAHRRTQPTALFALPLAYGYPLIFGFVNYCLSISLALLALGWWLRLGHQGRSAFRMGAFAIVAPAIMVVHLLGYIVLGLTAGGATIGAALEQGTPLPKATWRAFVACLPMAWPIALLLFWQGAASPGSSGWFALRPLAIGFTTILREQHQGWDLASGALVFAVAASPLLLRKSFAFSPVLLVPALLIWSLVICLPTNLLGTDFANTRLIPLACALTILAVRHRGGEAPWVAAAALLFLLLRLAITTVDMARADENIQRELAALDRIRPASRVASFVVLRCARSWEPPRLQTVGSFATSRRESFSNDEFSRREAQLLGIRYGDGTLIRPLPEPQVMSGPCSRWPNKPTLDAAMRQLPWNYVDYLWLIDVPAGQVPHDPHLRPVWTNGHSVVFEVRPAHAASLS